MRSLLLITLLGFSLSYGQGSLYQVAFEKAMSDSVITPDEQALLDLVKIDQDTTTAVLQETDLTGVGVSRPELNQEGRWRMIYYNMAVGNSLYGLGLPYLFKSEDPITYMGFQLVAAAGGFYYSYNRSKDQDLSMGRVAFNEMGSNLGMTSFFPIHAAIGAERWNDFDPHLRGALSYLMVAAPLGMSQGNKLFDRWKPSDGQASVITNATSLAAINGMATYFFIRGENEIETDTEFNNSYRAMALLGYGGALAGLHYSHEFLGDKPYTTGDALMVREASSLGMYMALRMLSVAEIESTRLNILLGMALVDGFSFWGDRLVEGIDFTEGDAVIVVMGTLAANGIWRGIHIMTGSGISSQVAGALDMATSFLGFYSTFQSVRDRRLEMGYPSKEERSINFRSRPTILGNFHDPIPGMTLEFNF